MGLNTNLKRYAEVVHGTEVRDRVVLVYDSVDGTQCLYSGIVYVSMQ